MKKTPLKQGKPLTRKTALKARGKPRFKRGRDPEYLAWIRTLPCWGAGRIHRDGLYHVCWGAVEAMHLKSRGAGGTDRDNALPGCRAIHGYQHDVGLASWAAAYRVTVDYLRRVALDLDARYRLEKEGA